jgi:hypothetical protein
MKSLLCYRFEPLSYNAFVYFRKIVDISPKIVDTKYIESKRTEQTTMNAAIATKLNVLESAIVRVEEWVNVLFVVVKGLGGRFVSKKIVETKAMTKVDVANKVVALIGGKVWVGGDNVRVYLAHKNGGYITVGATCLGCRTTKNAANEYSVLRAAGLLDYPTVASASVSAPVRSGVCLNCDLSTGTLLGRGYCTDCYGEC